MAALTPAAAEGLVAALQRAQAELDWVGNRLEEESSRSCRKGEVNALQLLTRINKLRRELPAVQEEAGRVLAAKQELVDAAKRQLTANTEHLHKLRRRAGIPTDTAADETYASFKQSLAEHEARLQAGYAGQQAAWSQEDLNAAYVQSALA